MTFKKFDTDKLHPSLLPVKPLEEVIKVLMFGAEKYGRDNWKEATEEDQVRYLDALMRHAMAYVDGEEADEETGLSHLAHLACNALFLLEFGLQEKTAEQEVPSLTPNLDAYYYELSKIDIDQYNRNRAPEDQLTCPKAAYKVSHEGSGDYKKYKVTKDWKET